jgi:hypothetical protein
VGRLSKDNMWAESFLSTLDKLSCSFTQCQAVLFHLSTNRSGSQSEAVCQTGQGYDPQLLLLRGTCTCTPLRDKLVH